MGTAGACAGAVTAGPVTAGPVTLDSEIAALTERVYLAPRESIDRLHALQARHPAMALRQQVQIAEQLGRAKLQLNDFGGAIEDGRRLETWGQAQHDEDIACLGVLTQAYAYWMMGKIDDAYALSRRAEGVAPSRLSAGTRVKVLLTTAQLNAEEHHAAAAMLALDEAARVAKASGSETLMFMAAKSLATIARTNNDVPTALGAVDRLLVLAERAPYRERLVRAKGAEFEVARAAGLSARASAAQLAKISLLRALRLDEALGGALNAYAAHELGSNHPLLAAAASTEAVALAAAAGDEVLGTGAQFNLALAHMALGSVAEGKREVVRLFAAGQDRATLLGLLPAYVGALTQAGQFDASVQADALRQKIAVEVALERVRGADKSRGQLDLLARQSQLVVREASDAHGQRNVWLGVALASGAGMCALLYLYRRLRAGHRQLEEVNRQLYVASNHDPLTGLVNRRYVHGYVAALRAPAAPGCGLVLLVDIDHFKRLNDAHGHPVGDAVLQVTAARLSALFRSEDIVARWGGEEFLIVLPTARHDRAAGIARQVLDALSMVPVVVKDLALPVTISVGMCASPLRLRDRELSWEEIVQLADQALYLAKQNGRNMAYGVVDASALGPLDLVAGVAQAWADKKLDMLEIIGDVGGRRDPLSDRRRADAATG